MITLNSSKQKFALNVPTQLSEITPEYLAKVTNHIHLCDNYAMIALVLTTKLSEYCYTLNNPKAKDAQVGVTPMIVKFKTSDDVHVDFNPNDIAIISNTELERGYHVNVPSMISSDKVGSYIMEDEDLRKAIQIGELKNENGERLGDNYIKLIQFKIVPISSITGSFTPINYIEDEFIVVKDKESK